VEPNSKTPAKVSSSHPTLSEEKDKACKSTSPNRSNEACIQQAALEILDNAYPALQMFRHPELLLTRSCRVVLPAYVMVRCLGLLVLHAGNEGSYVQIHVLPTWKVVCETAESFQCGSTPYGAGDLPGMVQVKKPIQVVSNCPGTEKAGAKVAKLLGEDPSGKYREI
jgi:hypothetical protein